MTKSLTALGVSPRVEVLSEPLTYSESSRHSFFADLVAARVYRDDNAGDRLARHQREMAVELAGRDARIMADLRSAGVEVRVAPNTTLGSGGEFDPPLWLISKFWSAARAGRTFGDLLDSQLLPAGVSSIHVPKIASGTTDDVQSSQGDANQSSDVTTSDISQAQIVTVAGEAQVSQQLQDLSPTGFDSWAYVDLHRAYNASLENGLINGSGTNGQLLGIANFSGVNTVSGAAGTTIAGLWPLFGQAAAAVTNNRKLQPEVWLMAGRRWFWITSSVDNSSRPIGSPRAGYRTPAGRVAGGYPPVGAIDGLPVYLSGAITAGTAADNAYCVRPSDMNLFESTEKYSVIVNPLSGTLQVRIQLHRYVGFIGATYTNGVGVLSGLPRPANF